LNCSIFRMIFETLLHQFGNANSWRFVRYVGVGRHSSQLTRSFNLHFKLSKNCTKNVDNRIVRRSLNQTLFPYYPHTKSSCVSQWSPPTSCMQAPQKKSQFQKWLINLFLV
jgi:deoxyribodipyrimidine photolyase